MKQKENLTLDYPTLLCQQIFGNLDKGLLVLAAKLPRDWVCSNICCSEPPLQLYRFSSNFHAGSRQHKKEVTKFEWIG